jgi:hypothetical protein
MFLSRSVSPGVIVMVEVIMCHIDNDTIFKIMILHKMAFRSADEIWSFEFYHLKPLHH